MLVILAPALLPLLAFVQKNLGHPRSSAAELLVHSISLRSLCLLLFKSFGSGFAGLR
jgi:hypothetical protein